MMKKGNNSKNMWKSLKEFENPEALSENKKNEFQDGVTDDFDASDLPGISRRKFLAILGASTAFTATACSDYQDKGEIVPYNNRPEEILPGKPNFYASSCNGCEATCGVLVKTREGRPIKIDGNPEHPINKGKICSKGQSSVLNLYDPERLTGPLAKNRKTNWATADKDVLAELTNAANTGKEIAVLSHSITSPTFKNLISDFQKQFPTAKFYSYEEVDNLAKIEAWEKSYGNRELPALKLDEADVILAVESDFIGSDPNAIENIRKYVSRKDIVKRDDINKLIVAEAGLSLTGMNADNRVRIKPELQYEFLLALANSVLSVKGFSKAGNAENEIKKHTLPKFAEMAGVDVKKLTSLSNVLIKAGKKALVLGGDSLSVDSQVIINILNETLNSGTLYDNSSLFVDNGLSTSEELKGLVANMNSGNVSVLINLNANPVYHLQGRYGFADAINNVNYVVSLVESKNETSEVSKYTLPIHQALESWGDHQVRTNVVSLQQPVIAPIFDTRQKEAVLLSWLKGEENKFSESDYSDYLKKSFSKNFFEGKGFAVEFSKFWNSALHDGFVEIDSNVKSGNLNNVSVSSPAKKDLNNFSVLLNRSYFVGDGRFLNNGWLQEIPHPVSKVTWDNYAAISPASAAKLDLEIGDMIKISADGRELELPVMLQPGVAENTLVCELGYGRDVVGTVGQESGFNVGQFIGLSGVTPWTISNVSVSKTGNKYSLASTQEHHALDDEFVKDIHLDRHIINEGTVKEYKENPEFLKRPIHEPHDLHGSHEYTENKWAMAIDLNKCISCAVCVSSCNVENNVPVVGKDQVEVGREMHWMRIDRYYTGEPDEPVTSGQPMLCQHCDNAPCENVCPVNATNHSPDGLNQMAYNRCVGTRYCANNCSYKVRRFNFYNFRDHLGDGYYENELTALAHNPEVTVRSRGVMEKCTFCVQKIMDVRSLAIEEGREVKPNEVVTACQQSCPADAIVFGDANNPESVVSEYRDHDLAYSVLPELNVKPNVTYIAKLRNTDTEDV